MRWFDRPAVPNRQISFEQRKLSCYLLALEKNKNHVSLQMMLVINFDELGFLRRHLKTEIWSVTHCGHQTEALHGPGKQRKYKMEGCFAIEKEVDKVLNKFGDADANAGSTLEDILQYINGIREELLEGHFEIFKG